MDQDPAPTPPPSADTPTAPGLATFLVIEFDAEHHQARYAVVAAPNEIQARETADAAARSAGRILVDVLTPAHLHAWIDRARVHPPDIAATAPAQ
jgi:hypothetical protein